MPLLLRAVAVVATAALLRLLFGAGHLGVDAMWSLQWGDDLLAGRTLSPTNGTTPHPLSNLAGAAVSVGGRDADLILSAATYLGAALLVLAAGLVALRLAGLPAGVAAALIVATRPELLASTTGGALDVWAAALTTGALAAALPRPHTPFPRPYRAAALLLAAGLLRPEAWALALAWWAWHAWQDRRPHPALLALGVAAPLLWVLHDAALTGDALFAIHQTEQAAGALRYVQNIPRGVGADVERAIRAIGNAIQAPLLLLTLVAAVASWLTLWRKPARATETDERPSNAALPRRAFALAWSALVLYAALILLQAANQTLIFSRFALVTAALAAALVPATAAYLAPRSWRPAWAIGVVAAIAILGSAGALRTSHQFAAASTARYANARDALRPGVPCAPLGSHRTGLSIYASRWTGLPLAQVRENLTGPLPGRATYVDVEQEPSAWFLRDPRAFAPIAAPGAEVVRATPGWTITSTCQ